MSKEEMNVWKGSESERDKDLCVCGSTTGPVKIEKKLPPQQCGNEVNGPPIVSVLSPARRVPGQSVAIRASKRY